MKNEPRYDLRTSVRRPADNPQRVKNPGEPRAFDGEDLARAGHLAPAPKRKGWEVVKVWQAPGRAWKIEHARRSLCVSREQTEILPKP